MGAVKLFITFYLKKVMYYFESISDLKKCIWDVKRLGLVPSQVIYNILFKKGNVLF